jgi:hypothetical protein
MSRPNSKRVCVDCGGPVARWNAVRCHPCKVLYQRPGYDVDPVTGCHIYRGTKDRNGYGIAKVNGRTTTAHVATWERERGPIPKGMELDHVVCHVRACINLDHLELVTKLVNMQRCGRAKLGPAEWAEIRSLADSMTRVAIGKRFGITPAHVTNIIKGRHGNLDH